MSRLLADQIEQYVLGAGGAVCPVQFDRAYIELESGERFVFTTLCNGEPKPEGWAVGQTYESAVECVRPFLDGIQKLIEGVGPGTLFWRIKPEYKSFQETPVIGPGKFGEPEGPLRHHIYCRLGYIAGTDHTVEPSSMPGYVNPCEVETHLETGIETTHAESYIVFDDVAYPVSMVVGAAENWLCYAKEKGWKYRTAGGHEIVPPEIKAGAS